MEYEIKTTSQFDKWFARLKDRTTKIRVLARLARVEVGNFGDTEQLSKNLAELRFHFGKGIRVYYTIQNKQVVLLLKGGDKSTQSKDIQQAQKITDELENNHGN